MAGHSYFPPQSPLQQPPPSQYQAFSPQYPPPAQNSPSPQPWNQPQLCTSPPPPAPPTPYNPSAFSSPVLSPRDAFNPPRNPRFSQPRPQSSVGGYPGPPYSQLPGNAPPTPALSPSSVPYCPPLKGSSISQYGPPPAPSAAQAPASIPYDPSSANTRESTGPTTQCFELPSQPQSGQYFPPPPPTQPGQQQQPPPTHWNTQTSYGQPPINAPPTPAYTPGPYGYSASNIANSNGPTTQYFPLQPPAQLTADPPGLFPAQSSQVLANTPSKFAQTISSATQAQPPQDGPPLQQAKSQDPPVFEMSSNPSPPPQAQSLFSPPQPVGVQVTAREEVQFQDQPAAEAQIQPSPSQQIPSELSPAPDAQPHQQAQFQGPSAEGHQSPPPALQQFQPQAPVPQQVQSQHPPEQLQPQPQSVDQVQPQPLPPNQIQDQWAQAQPAPVQQTPAQHSQSQLPPIQQLQSHCQPAQEAQFQPPPVQQVHYQLPPNQQAQPSPVQQVHTQPPSNQQVQLPPVQQIHSQPPPHQQGQSQTPPPEQFKSQYAPASQAQLPPSGGVSQYPPPPPYSQVANPANAPPVFNQSIFKQQPPPVLPQNGPTSPTYPNQPQPFQTSYPQEKQHSYPPEKQHSYPPEKQHSYPPEKQQYEQSLVQSFQVQLQVTSTGQQPQEKQQYQPSQYAYASPYQQPQSPLSGQQAQDKQLHEQRVVQTFQQQWHFTPTGQHPQEKQQYHPNQAPHAQQQPQYPGVGQPQTQYQPQPQYPPVGSQQNLGGPLMQQTPAVSAGFMPPPPPFVPVGGPQPAKDDHKSSKAKRFLGDTLVGRVARSSVATVSSTVKMPLTLSPWGDNNPVTLPNVRYRDAVLFTTFAVVGVPLVDGASNVVTDVFGADTFISEIISSGAGFITANIIVKYGVFQIVEQAIDKGVLEHILPEVERTIRTTSVKSLQVSIKHKLMGVEADIRFVGTYPTTSSMAYDKGWFCPYLFASSRTPVIPRNNDFTIAQFFGPYVAADTAFTHKVLSESPCVIPLCDPNPMNHLPHSRLFIFFTGISPFRAGMWSTSRRPGCAQIIFHLLDGCPALVLPVAKARTPVLAWSPWTLTQMQKSGTSGYSPEKHIGQIMQWVAPLVEWPGLYPCVRDVSQAFDRTVWRVLSMMINGALAAPGGADGKVLGKVDAERAGIVMFRY